MSFVFIYFKYSVIIKNVFCSMCIEIEKDFLIAAVSFSLKYQVSDYKHDQPDNITDFLHSLECSKYLWYLLL